MHYPTNSNTTSTHIYTLPLSAMMNNPYNSLPPSYYMYEGNYQQAALAQYDTYNQNYQASHNSHPVKKEFLEPRPKRSEKT